jgi:selenide,water dikinase
MEDAALVRPESGPTLVFTVDFITPIVDDPETFGAIAAANSISDVYAMGGEPQVALVVCGFPEDRVSSEILTRIFQGARNKAAEANCAIVGGHTVIDPELKYGLCVIGAVEPKDVLSQRGARPGDRLVLTKPIGSGVASQAIKKQKLSDEDIASLVAVLTTLNKGAKDAALAAGARAATDVTGFGLLGHLLHLLLGSEVAARLEAPTVPVFDFARKLIERDLVPGGTRRNLAYVNPHVSWGPAIGETDRLLLADAQTSGGLLIAVPPEGEERILEELERRRAPASAVIGTVVEGEPGRIEVVGG